jgi:quinoprotein glucose dehydrogenase
VDPDIFRYLTKKIRSSFSWCGNHVDISTMIKKRTLTPILLLILSASIVQSEDWTYYGFDQGGTRFSPLQQIDRSNVTNLEVAWTHRYGDLPRYADRSQFAGYHTTPILLPAAAGRSLVLCTPFSRVIALDPATGKERWNHAPELDLPEIPTRLKCLGVAYWQDSQATQGQSCAHRIIFGTHDRRIIAVDATTGTLCPGFGDSGQVDVNPLIAAATPAHPDPAGTTFSAPPVIVNGVVVIGNINNMKNQFANAPSGAIRAFDARSGKFLWSFDPVPRNADDPQAKNWTPGALATTGGGNAWTVLSADEERDLVFIPTSSASPNFFGGTRPGDNRYANSVVALQAATGEVAWHFQHIHHDVWDWDTPAAPMLVDITRDGQTIPAVVQLTKQGYVFVLHRDTGVPLFEVVERPVPTDGVPGEVLSPTQPFPVKPPALMKTGIEPEDAWGLTFWDRGKCREQIETARHGDIFTPPSTKGWIMYPSTAGGPNWGGGAFDPGRNLVVTNVSKVGLWLRLLPQTEIDPTAPFDAAAGAPMGPPAPIRGTDYALEQRIFLSPIYNPCTPPPWSSLVAVDVAEGSIAWDVPLGTIEKLSPVPIPLKWGSPNAGGPIITAGGLVFIGATADHTFRAFDIDSGDEIWVTETPSASHSTPMTYTADGRQFVVIASGGHMFINPGAIDDWLVAYALPID